MKLKIKKAKKLDEMSSASGGAIQGYGAPLGDPEGVDTFNKKEEREQRLKGDRLDEMFSSSGQSGRNYRIRISGEKEHAGHVERSQHQGLRNVMEADETLKLDDDTYVDTFSRDLSMADILDDFMKGASDSKPVGVSRSEGLRMALEDKGYEVIKELGGGMMGQVFLVKNKGGKEYAAKIIFNRDEDAQREMRNYDTISKARSKDPLIEKHFPAVDDIFQVFSAAGDTLSVIIMEVLQPLTDDQAAFIPDAAFLLGRDKPWRLAAADEFFDGPRDSSRRMQLYAQNNLKELSQRFGIHTYNLTRDYRGEWIEGMSKEKYSEMADSVSEDSLLDIIKLEASAPKMTDRFIKNRMKAFKEKLGAGSNAVYLVEILEKDFPNAKGANAAIIQVAFKIMLAGLATNTDISRIDRQIEDFAKVILANARKTTQIPMGYKEKDVQAGGKQREKEYTTNQGLHSAIQALHRETGLLAKDLHDQNVMARSNGDLVIVDVGLFRMSKPVKESRTYRLKVLTKPKK